MKYLKFFLFNVLWKVVLNINMSFSVEFEASLEEKFLEVLVRLVMTSCRLGEISGGFGETSYDPL